MNELASEQDIKGYLLESVREASLEGAIISNAQSSPLTEEDIHRLSSFYHIFGGEKRYQLVRYLCESDRPVTWTDMLFEVRLNPKSLRDYLKDLKSYRMVEHNQYGFRATDYGKKSFEAVEKIGRLACLKEEV